MADAPKVALKRNAGITALFVALAALTGLLVAADTPAGTGGFDRKTIETIVHDYLVEHPEVILEAFNSLQAKQAAANADKARETIAAETPALLNDPHSPTIGNPNGDVTLVEFFDYNCGYCRRSALNVLHLVENDKNLRVIFKELPMLGDDSIAAARVSTAAAKQKGYAAFHFKLLGAESHVGEAEAVAAAKAAGLDMERLKRDMSALDFDAIMASNHALATKLGIDGTPAYVIGSILLPGAVPLDEFKEAIKDTRDKG